MPALDAIRAFLSSTTPMSNQPSSHPAAHNDHVGEFYSTTDPPRATPYTIPSVTPYLGLRARLSQIWINRWTILLLLVLARTLIAIAGLQKDIGSARREALSACSGVESVGSAMASMPHYMSQGVNELTASGVQKAVNGLMDMTMLSVTGVEEIVVFVINMMTSTYVCLITLAVSSSLHAAIDLAHRAQDFVNKTVGDIGNGMDKTVKGFEDDWNKFLSGLNSGLTTITGHKLTPPSLDLSGPLNQLHDMTIPANLNDDLNKLNGSIPTFEQVNNLTNTAIRFPFEKLKGMINDSLPQFQFNRSMFPVPQKERLSFCSDDDGINHFFDTLVGLAHTLQKTFIIVLIIAAILVCIPMAWREVNRWKTMKERSRLVHSHSYDPMDVVYIVSRPYTASAGIKASSKFGTPRRQNLVRWVIAYATSTPALFLLSLGIAGLFSCACQAILLKSVEKEVPVLTRQVANFTDKVVHSLNNASQSWATGTNRVIADTNNDINNKMLGWVNVSTHAINDTLNTFVGETTKVLNDTFGGTVLYDPIMEVLNCLVGLKVASFQKGLTWVSDHAHVDIPELPKDTFSLDTVAKIASNNPTDTDSFLAAPGDATTDKISQAAKSLTDQIQSGIRTEALISTVIICMWLFIVLIAIIRAVSLWFVREKTRGEGGTLDAYGPPPNPSRDPHNEFHDIPLGDVPAPRPTTPAPDYAQSVVHQYPISRVGDAEHDYQESKLGFGTAGQRSYGDGLRREPTKGARESTHGEVWYGNEKAYI